MRHGPAGWRVALRARARTSTNAALQGGYAGRPPAPHLDCSTGRPAFEGRRPRSKPSTLQVQGEGGALIKYAADRVERAGAWRAALRAHTKHTRRPATSFWQATASHVVTQRGCMAPFPQLSQIRPLPEPLLGAHRRQDRSRHASATHTLYIVTLIDHKGISTHLVTSKASRCLIHFASSKLHQPVQKSPLSITPFSRLFSKVHR